MIREIHTIKEAAHEWVREMNVTFIQPHFSCYEYSGYMELTIK